MITLEPPQILLDGLTMVESGRWRNGRLWFGHWGSGEVVAVDLDGNAEVIAPGPPGMGWSIDWLPDGRLLTTGEEVTVHEPDGSRRTWSGQGGNEIVVHPRGHVYVDGAEFDFLAGALPEPGWIRRIDPAGGSVVQVADDIDFPNGMVLSPDGSTLVIAESMGGRLTAFDVAQDGSLGNRRVWADGLQPDGICMDADGGIWAQPDQDGGGACLRVLEGGEITHRVETTQRCFACALGGPEGRHLFLLCNEFEGVEQLDAVLARRSARIEVAEVPAAG